jgi:hypothetical protein
MAQRFGDVKEAGEHIAESAHKFSSLAEGSKKMSKIR